jgi:hypothetical protein
MVPELVHQLRASKAKVIMTVAASLKIAVAAAKEVGISSGNILLFSLGGETSPDHPTVDALVAKGLQRMIAFDEPRLASGNAQQKVKPFSVLL